MPARLAPAGPRRNALPARRTMPRLHRSLTGRQYDPSPLRMRRVPHAPAAGRLRQDARATSPLSAAGAVTPGSILAKEGEPRIPVPAAGRKRRKPARLAGAGRAAYSRKLRVDHFGAARLAPTGLDDLARRWAGSMPSRQMRDREEASSNSRRARRR